MASDRKQEAQKQQKKQYVTVTIYEKLYMGDPALGKMASLSSPDTDTSKLKAQAEHWRTLGKTSGYGEGTCFLVELHMPPDEYRRKYQNTTYLAEKDINQFREENRSYREARSRYPFLLASGTLTESISEELATGMKKLNLSS